MYLKITSRGGTQDLTKTVSQGPPGSSRTYIILGKSVETYKIYICEYADHEGPGTGHI